jgi:type IV pilus assembly protein PilV
MKIPMKSCVELRPPGQSLPQGQSRPQRGFTLVEVLVALVVLGIGLLGVEKLVLTGLKANDSAYMRSQATALACAILDDMRANRQIAMTQGYDVSMTAYSVPSALCVQSSCTSEELAQYDVYQWKQRLGAASPSVAGALPGGNGSIVTVTGTNNQTTATITVQWNDALAQNVYTTPASSTSSPMSITLETVL